MTDSLVIRAGVVIVGDGTPPLADRAIRVVEGRIAEVMPGKAAPADALAFPNHTLVPGFVDAHVHLLFDYAADHEITRAAVETGTPPGLTLRAFRHGAECLRGGVTTVRDLGDRDLVVAGLRDAVNAGLVPGPRILTAGPPVTITGGHLGWLGGAADGMDNLIHRTRQLCASGVDVVKVMASGGNMTRESNKHLPQFTVAEIRAVVTEAHRGGKKVAAHALNAEAMRRSIAAGVNTIEHCGWVGSDGTIDLQPADLDQMLAAGSVGVLTMAGIARQLLPTPAWYDAAAHRVALTTSRNDGDLFADHEWARQMLAAGIPLALASDAGVRFTPFADFLDSVRCGVVALGVDASAAIGLATLAGARALGLADEVGSIQVGKAADFAILDRTIDIGDTELGAIDQVWRGGKLVAEQGRLVW